MAYDDPGFGLFAGWLLTERGSLCLATVTVGANSDNGE
jgi:hypothetical protein